MDLRTHRKTLSRTSRYPSRIRHALTDVHPEHHHWNGPSGATIAGFAALAVIIAASAYYGPDFVRYLKIRRM